MRKNLPIVLILSATSVWAAYPGDIFLPGPTFSDSFSLRETPNDPFSSVKGPVFRKDWLPRETDASGRPSRLDVVVPGDTVTDSTVVRYDWSLDIPPVDKGASLPTRTPTRTVEQTFLRGILQGTDTTWSSWDPVNRILVRTSNNQYGGCRWQDSSAFDAENRLVLERECDVATDGTSKVPDYFIYRAWFANTTDTLPISESAWDSSSMGESLDDTLLAKGNPNRPDSLLWGGGSRIEILLRDGFGLVVKTIEYTSSTPASKDSAIYAYDAGGRLVEILQPSLPDTARFFYAWDDRSSLHPTVPVARGIHLMGKNLVLDLPAPDRVLVDVVGLDGKWHGSPLDLRLPAGQTILPIDARLGEIVRVRALHGTTSLLSLLR